MRGEGEREGSKRGREGKRGRDRGVEGERAGVIDCVG